LFQKPCKEFGFYLTRFKHNTGILRCNNLEKENAIILLTNIKKINTNQVIIETIATSGTIKTLIKKHLNNDTLK
jgi:RNase P/RNase MRP subunit POP5